MSSPCAFVWRWRLQGYGRHIFGRPVCVVTSYNIRCLWPHNGERPPSWHHRTRANEIRMFAVVCIKAATFATHGIINQISKCKRNVFFCAKKIIKFNFLCRSRFDETWSDRNEADAAPKNTRQMHIEALLCSFINATHAVVNVVAPLKSEFSVECDEPNGRNGGMHSFRICVMYRGLYRAATALSIFDLVLWELEHCFTFAIWNAYVSIALHMRSFVCTKLALENSFPLYVQLNAIFFEFIRWADVILLLFVWDKFNSTHGPHGAAARRKMSSGLLRYLFCAWHRRSKPRNKVSDPFEIRSDTSDRQPFVLSLRYSHRNIVNARCRWHERNGKVLLLDYMIQFKSIYSVRIGTEVKLKLQPNSDATFETKCKRENARRYGKKETSVWKVFVQHIYVGVRPFGINNANPEEANAILQSQQQWLRFFFQESSKSKANPPSLGHEHENYSSWPHITCHQLICAQIMYLFCSCIN